MRTFERPIVVYSACLAGEAVRYNGATVEDKLAKTLSNYVNVIKVCPEVAIGLGVPREKIIVYRQGPDMLLFQPATGKDLTKEMISFTEEFLGSLPEVDGFLLKSKSPSCGVSNTLHYRDPWGKEFYARGKGLFAKLVIERFPHLPVEDEGRLKNPEIRDHFLSSIFALADLRSFRPKSIKDLMNFHQRYKYFLMAHHQLKLKQMGRLVAEGSKSLEETYESYKKLFVQTIANRPSKKKHYNVILHIYGHLSSKLKEREKHHFLKLAEDYKEGKIPRTLLIELLKNWAYRFENEYLMTQTYLWPYPEELQHVYN